MPAAPTALGGPRQAHAPTPPGSWLDACNMLNDNAPLAINDTLGPQWQVPQNILLARFVEVRRAAHVVAASAPRRLRGAPVG